MLILFHRVVCDAQRFISLEQCLVVVGDHQQLVAFHQNRIAFGDEITFVAHHHNGQCMVGQGKFHQLVTVRKDFRSDIDLAHGAFDAFREFDAEYVFPFRFVDQSEPFGCLRHGRGW